MADTEPEARKPYHHGNLRQALVEASLALIEEKGPLGFTLAEAARAAGVSPAAPYRHFRNREDLIEERAAPPAPSNPAPKTDTPRSDRPAVEKPRDVDSSVIDDLLGGDGKGGSSR